MSKESLEGVLTNALWRYWETSLPDTPWRMAVVLANEVRKAGYINEGEE